MNQPYVAEPIQNELYGHRHEEQPHESHHDANSRMAKVTPHPIGSCQDSVRNKRSDGIAGGIILLLIGIDMLQARRSPSNEVPGPGSISTVMVLMSESGRWWQTR